MSLLTLLRITSPPAPSEVEVLLNELTEDLSAISNRTDTVLGYRSNLTDRQRDGISDIRGRAQIALNRITAFRGEDA